jgi:hypothetical protein
MPACVYSSGSYLRMYDRYALAHLLRSLGFRDVPQKGFNTSLIEHWVYYNLNIDSDGMEWKPLSLYMEALK